MSPCSQCCVYLTSTARCRTCITTRPSSSSPLLLQQRMTCCRRRSQTWTTSRQLLHAGVPATFIAFESCHTGPKSCHADAVRQAIICRVLSTAGGLAMHCKAGPACSALQKLPHRSRSCHAGPVHQAIICMPPAQLVAWPCIVKAGQHAAHCKSCHAGPESCHVGPANQAITRQVLSTAGGLALRCKACAACSALQQLPHGPSTSGHRKHGPSTAGGLALHCKACPACNALQKLPHRSRSCHAGPVHQAIICMPPAQPVAWSCIAKPVQLCLCILTVTLLIVSKVL